MHLAMTLYLLRLVGLDANQWIYHLGGEAPELVRRATKELESKKRSL